MKRIVVLMLALALVFTSIANLGAQAQKLVDLEVWALGAVTEAGPPPDNWVGYQIIRDRLGINLKLVLQPATPTDQDTKLNLAAAANSLPDLFGVSRDVMVKLAKAGLIAPVDSLLPKMPIRTKGHYSDPVTKKLVMLSGKMYGLPDPGSMPRVEGVVIRKDWLDKLKLPVPKTLDELYAVGKAFTDRDPDGNGKADTYGFGAFIETSGMTSIGYGRRFEYVFGAFGVAGTWNLDSAAKFQFNFRDPNFRKAIEWVKKVNDGKIIDPDWPVLKKDEFRARWKQGKFGIFWEQFAALHTQANYKDFDANFPNGELIPIMPPTGPQGKSSNGLDMANARIYSVSTKAVKEGKLDAIARLLEWMASPEGYYLNGFGVEGVNYKKDSKGFISVEGIPAEQQYSHKSQQPLTQLRNMVYINNDIELKVRYLDYKSANGKNMDPLATWQFFANSPYTDSTGAGFIDPPKNAADFTRFYNENLIKFALGQVVLDDKSWAAFVAGMDSLGAKDIETQAKAKLIDLGMLD
jgi:putative aldouronate transport system substrate-binding protein